MNKRAIGQILKAMKVVSDEQIQQGLNYAKNKDCRLGEALVKTGVCKQALVSRALAKHWGIPFANLAKGEIRKPVKRFC